MKLSKLNFSLVMVSMLLAASACNNDKKSGNISTSETDTATITPANTDNGTTQNVTSDTSSGTTSPATTAKKTGKVSIKPADVDKSTAMKADAMGYYNYTEVQPSFAGGQSSLESYINNNIEYPQDAIDNSVEGTVYVAFTIDENGKVGNAKTTGAKLGYGLDDEAVRVINNMSKWTAGTNGGKKVKAWYTLPITYRLE